METKVCRICSNQKNINDFEKRQDSKDGFRNECKTCRSIKHSKWRKENIEKVKAKNKRYVEKNKDKIKIYSAEWRKNNPESQRRTSSNWRKNNPEKAKEKDKRYRLNNREKVKKRKKNERDLQINELKDSYIKTQLYNKGFKLNEVTTELIEVQRLIIKTKRLCKTLQN
jgi:hypothetical protein